MSKALSKASASFTGTSRSPTNAAAHTGSERIAVEQLDLIDPASIDGFVARWLATGRPFHILINGAGASGGPERDARL